MHRIAVLAVALIVLSGSGTADAKVRGGAGTTAFVQGRLRVFGVHHSTRDESGFAEYACLGRRRRPVRVGSDTATTGTASSVTSAYAVGGGGRYLAAYTVNDGEGGPGAS